jgi:hypothetical protein
LSVHPGEAARIKRRFSGVAAKVVLTRGSAQEQSAMRIIVFAFAILMLVAGDGLGQSIDPAKFSAVQKENAQKLRAYTWKQRLELQLKGETKKVLLNQMRYDVDGKQQKTPLSTGEPQQQAAQVPAGKRGGRVKAKVVENKKEEFKEMMEGLAALVTSSGHIPPDKLKAALSQAKVTAGQGDYMARAVLQYPAKELLLKIDNFEYQPAR